jgi:ribose transport system ATP-binding protein
VSTVLPEAEPITGLAEPVALRLRGMSKRFGATVALDEVELTVVSGEVHALIGENGAGKSTLMNILAGALRPDAGEMRLFDAPYSPGSTLEARRRGIALIHQELSLCPHLTVTENILLGTESARWGWLDRGANRQRALALLENFSHPEIRPDRRVGELPIPAQQVVEICRALSANARVVLMDEPTSTLPRADVERLFDLIRRLRAAGIAVVYISHFLEEVREIADRYTVLRDGRSVDSGELAVTPDERLVGKMVGRPMSGLFPQRARRTDGEVVLRVRGLAAPPAVREASFELRRGEILGIAGLMGSGRTEMVRALFGLDPAGEGTVDLRSAREALRGGTPARRLAQGVGYLSEDRKGEGLALPLSVADNLTMTRFRACSRRGGWVDRRKQHQATEAVIREVGIRARSPAQPVRTLSGGNQQKVAIGRLLYQDADVLLLDEPTRGIDIGSKAQVYETIARAAEQGKAVLMISSYLPELFGMCDRLAVMSRGRLSPAKAIGEWTPDAVMVAAIGTTSDDP